MTNFFARSAAGMFGSAHLAAHLLRGAAAIGLLFWGITHQAASPVAALAAGVVALVALRGCPVCWAIGLVETVANHLRQTPLQKRDAHD